MSANESVLPAVRVTPPQRDASGQLFRETQTESAAETQKAQAGSQAQAPAAAPAPSKAPPPASRDSEQRLVIDQDPTTGSFVYKTVDRVTGEVLSQLPREEVLRLRDDPAYRAGAVIATVA